MIPVLFFAFEFPPLSQTGVHRSAKLTKYLNEFGIEPIVITLDAKDASESFGSPLDPGLCDELPSGLKVYRLPCPRDVLHRSTNRLAKFLSVFLQLDDTIADCLRPSLRLNLDAIVKRHRPKAVYVSMPPFSAGVLAAEVADKLKLPLLVDMRDGWSHYCVTSFPTYVHFRLVYEREKRVFAAADRVVTVTPQLANVFRRTHPELPRQHFDVIPNGFDGDISFLDRIAIEPRPKGHEFSIGYVGRYYYDPKAREAALLSWWQQPGHRKLHYRPAHEDWLYRSPYFLLKTLARLKQSHPEEVARVTFHHVGHVPNWLPKMAEDLGVRDALRLHGFVTHQQALQLTQGFDAQLCTSVKVHGGEDYALASKTFDYVRAGKPILGLVTSGAQRDFLERSGLAVLADPDDASASDEAVLKLVRGGFELCADHTFIRGFHRREQARAMAKLLTELATR